MFDSKLKSFLILFNFVHLDLVLALISLHSRNLYGLLFNLFSQHLNVQLHLLLTLDMLSTL